MLLSERCFGGGMRAAYSALDIVDVAGRAVVTLLEGEYRAGRHEATWDGRDGSGRPAASGVYLYRLKSGISVETRSMVLIK